jgi:hypothetical protein
MQHCKQCGANSVNEICDECNTNKRGPRCYGELISIIENEILSLPIKKCNFWDNISYLMIDEVFLKYKIMGYISEYNFQIERIGKLSCMINSKRGECLKFTVEWEG